MTTVEPTVAERHEAIDIRLLSRVGDDLTAAYLVDRQNARVIEQAEAGALTRPDLARPDPDPT